MENGACVVLLTFILSAISRPAANIINISALFTVSPLYQVSFSKYTVAKEGKYYTQQHGVDDGKKHKYAL